MIESAASRGQRSTPNQHSAHPDCALYSPWQDNFQETAVFPIMLEQQSEPVVLSNFRSLDSCRCDSTAAPISSNAFSKVRAGPIRRDSSVLSGVRTNPIGTHLRRHKQEGIVEVDSAHRGSAVSYNVAESMKGDVSPHVIDVRLMHQNSVYEHRHVDNGVCLPLPVYAEENGNRSMLSYANEHAIPVAYGYHQPAPNLPPSGYHQITPLLYTLPVDISYPMHPTVGAAQHCFSDTPFNTAQPVNYGYSAISNPSVEFYPSSSLIGQPPSPAFVSTPYMCTTFPQIAEESCETVDLSLFVGSNHPRQNPAAYAPLPSETPLDDRFFKSMSVLRMLDQPAVVTAPPDLLPTPPSFDTGMLADMKTPGTLRPLATFILDHEKCKTEPQNKTTNAPDFNSTTSTNAVEQCRDLSLSHSTCSQEYFPSSPYVVNSIPIVLNTPSAANSPPLKDQTTSVHETEEESPLPYMKVEKQQHKRQSRRTPIPKHHMKQMNIKRLPESISEVVCRWENCGQIFLDASSLGQHVVDHLKCPKGKGVHFCRWDGCPRAHAFSRREKLMNHVRLHTGDKPYTCIECDRVFSRRDAYKNHMATHKDEFPHECECGKRYKYRRSLKKHMNQSHPKPESLIALEMNYDLLDEIDNSDDDESLV
ncbi:hypothetical protein BJ742DRAFT_710191 [Cladochytrium replicatum]|nr:hypothetical protein BJ742DRAFT_710191 [Cladochytrium replicatum]